MSTTHERIQLGDLACWRIRHAGAELVVSEQGAQILRYQPAGGKPLIWLSDEAAYAAGKSVRGGVPVCWPCLLYTSPSPRDLSTSRMPSSA